MKKIQKAKLKEFQKHLREKKIPIAFFYNLHMQEFDPNFYYFTDYEGVGFLLVPANGKPSLIVPEMEYARAKRQATVPVVVAKTRMVAVLRKKIGKVKKIGIDKKGMTLAFFERFKKELKSLKAVYVDIGQNLLELRATKTAEEIRRIRKACRITDDIFAKTFFNFKKFKTEADIAAFMIGEANRLGLEIAFTPIVASGANATEPHHGSANVKLKKGFCIIDYGLKYKGYSSDMTRTVYLGKPTQKDIFLYNLVLNAQKKAIDYVKEGVKCRDQDKVVQETFGKYKKYFIHSSGHGVGLEVHEHPAIAKAEKARFKAGMVTTIEPGLYISGRTGIRIEDDLLIKEDKAEILTKTGKNLLIIP